MKIAIIGTGNVGGALARAWARAGHRIFLGVRNLQDQKVLALTAEGPLTSAHSPAEAVNDAETVLFAIPPNALRQVLDNLGDLKGKVLIDATNSVRTRAGD
jgi:predicted dinucleotide-binding enzyme